MTIFYVLRCPLCGQHQACEVNDIRSYTFKCRHDDCRKSRKLKQDEKIGLQVQHYGPYPSGRHAAMMVSTLNGRAK